MTHIDQIIADALAGLPETDVATLAREVVRLREASAVVVPERKAARFARHSWATSESRQFPYSSLPPPAPRPPAAPSAFPASAAAIRRRCLETPPTRPALP